jgi:hypothetical protein
VVIGGSTSLVAGPVPGANTAPVLTINGRPITANPQGNYIIGTQTLIPGSQAIIVSGTPVSLAVVPVATTPALTINGQTITPNPQGDFVIGSQTLTPGGAAITVSGTPISLAPIATAVVVGGTTTPLGSITISIFPNNGGAATGTATAPTPAYYTGEAGRDIEILIARSMFIALSLSAFLVWL